MRTSELGVVMTADREKTVTPTASCGGSDQVLLNVCLSSQRHHDTEGTVGSYIMTISTRGCIPHGR